MLVSVSSGNNNILDNVPSPIIKTNAIILHPLFVELIYNEFKIYYLTC